MSKPILVITYPNSDCLKASIEMLDYTRDTITDYHILGITEDMKIEILNGNDFEIEETSNVPDNPKDFKGVDKLFERKPYPVSLKPFDTSNEYYAKLKGKELLNKQKEEQLIKEKLDEANKIYDEQTLYTFKYSNGEFSLVSYKNMYSDIKDIIRTLKDKNAKPIKFSIL